MSLSHHSKLHPRFSHDMIDIPSNRNMSTSSSTSVSDCPTPTVSTITMSNPAASQSVIAELQDNPDLNSYSHYPFLSSESFFHFRLPFSYPRLSQSAYPRLSQSAYPRLSQPDHFLEKENSNQLEEIEKWRQRYVGHIRKSTDIQVSEFFDRDGGNLLPRVTPPRLPREGEGRMKAFGSFASLFMRVLSPKMDPPVLRVSEWKEMYTPF